MSDAVVKTDRTSGNQTVTWFLDQGVRWFGSAELHESDEASDLVDLTGWTARMVVRLADGDRAIALELAVGDGLVNDGATIAWDLDAETMGALERTYDVELKVFPGGVLDQAELLMDGQIVMRPRVASLVESA